MSMIKSIIFCNKCGHTNLGEGGDEVIDGVNHVLEISHDIVATIPHIDKPETFLELRMCVHLASIIRSGLKM